MNALRSLAGGFLARRQQAAAHVLDSGGHAADQIQADGFQVGLLLHKAGKVFRRAGVQAGPAADNMGHRFGFDLRHGLGQIQTIGPPAVLVRAQMTQINVAQFMAEHGVGRRRLQFLAQADAHFPRRLPRPRRGEAPAQRPHRPCAR